MSEGGVVEKRIEEVVTAWSRTVFAAPRRLASLVTRVESLDQTIERVFTDIVRRDVVVESAASRERRTTASRLDPDRIDPFAYTTETLRANSEYVAPCTDCSASGSTRCGGCSGSGRRRCSNCTGSGKELKRYKNGNSRLINCKVCRASGSVECGSCGSSGVVTCKSCHGSGHRLIWLSFKETSRRPVHVSPEGPITYAHPRLLSSSVLDASDLEAFTVESSVEARGPLQASQVPDGGWSLVAKEQGSVDPRLERIVEQQYLRLAVVRRDVTYEMAGTASTLVLAGKDLSPATTADAVRPINRRAWLWMIGALLVSTGVWSVRFSQIHSASYFASLHRTTAIIAALATLLLIVWLGGMLRSWRPGFRSHGLGWFECGVGLAALPALAALVVVPHLRKPTIGELDRALAVGDLNTARTVSDALKELDPNDRDVLDAEDRVMLGEAAHVAGEERLKLLDGVAARSGKQAAAAASVAREDRLEQLRSWVDTKQPSEALAAADRWFPGTKDPQVAEERARAFEKLEQDCQDLACSFDDAAKSDGARETPPRVAHLASVEAAVAAALTTPSVAEPDARVRAHRANDIARLAAKVVALPDARTLRERAQQAQLWAAADLSKIPLLGAKEAVTDEILGPSTNRDGNLVQHHWADLDIFLSMDAKGVCRGLYAVGVADPRSSIATERVRRIRSKEWPADRIISQALGRSAAVHAGSKATLSWYEAGYPLTARYWNGDLVELRVGDASP